MDSQSWELIIIDNEFSTLTSTTTAAALSAAITTGLGTIAITTTTATSSTTTTSAFDKFVIVVSGTSLETEELSTFSLCLCVQVRSCQLGHLS